MLLASSWVLHRVRRQLPIRTPARPSRLRCGCSGSVYFDTYFWLSLAGFDALRTRADMVLFDLCLGFVLYGRRPDLAYSTLPTSSTFCFILVPHTCASNSFRALGPKHTILSSTGREWTVRQFSLRPIHIRLYLADMALHHFWDDFFSLEQGCMGLTGSLPHDPLPASAFSHPASPTSIQSASALPRSLLLVPAGAFNTRFGTYHSSAKSSGTDCSAVPNRPIRLLLFYLRHISMPSAPAQWC